MGFSGLGCEATRSSGASAQECKVQGSGLSVWDSGFGKLVQDFGSRAWDCRDFEGLGFGYRIEGLIFFRG